MTGIDRIHTDAAPAPGGHYSQGAAYGELVFVSGQLPAAGAEGFEDQARGAIGAVLAILEAAGSGPERVLKVTAYIVGIENWPALNRVYAELFGDARPARAVVPVPALHHGLLVEVEAVAVRGGGRSD